MRVLILAQSGGLLSRGWRVDECQSLRVAYNLPEAEVVICSQTSWIHTGDVWEEVPLLEGVARIQILMGSFPPQGLQVARVAARAQSWACDPWDLKSLMGEAPTFPVRDYPGSPELSGEY